MKNEFMSITPHNIWQYRQNKVSYIVRDLAAFVSPEIVYRVLLARGVFKWLSVRREIIKIKNVWRDRIRNAHIELRAAKLNKDWRKAIELKGRIKTLEECRKEVRILCHSERWQAPDFDKDAQRWLENQDRVEMEFFK